MFVGSINYLLVNYSLNRTIQSSLPTPFFIGNYMPTDPSLFQIIYTSTKLPDLLLYSHRVLFFQIDLWVTLLKKFPKIVNLLTQNRVFFKTKLQKQYFCQGVRLHSRVGLCMSRYGISLQLYSICFTLPKKFACVSWAFGC